MADENEIKTEKMQAEIDKASSVIAAWRSSVSATIKTTTEQRIAEEKLIQQLIKEQGYKATQAAEAVKSIKLEKEEQKLQQEAIALEKESQELQKKVDQERTEGAKRVAKSLGDFAVGSVKAANGMYTAENAFSAVTPVVTLMGNTLSGVIEGMAKMATGFSIAGFSFGGMAEGAAKLAGVGISLVTQAMNMALENAGKLVENYNQLSKVGVTFGGDIEKMRESAAAGGLALDTYTKFVTKNIESLSTFGGSTQRAADTVMKLTRATADNNEKLLVMYGGFEALNEAAVGYVDLISKTGFDVTKNVNSLNAGAASYLINMKELSALTGQSADAIKKEQEARMKSASYQVALANMSAEEQIAAKNKVSMVTRMYGKEAGDLLEEMIAGNGTVISESGLQLQSMLGPVAQSIKEIFTVGNGEDAVKRTAETMSKYADSIDAFSKQNKDLMFLNYGTQDQVLQMMNSILSQSRQTLNRQRDLSSAQVELDKENEKPMSKSAKSLEGVIESLNKLKMDIDDKTIKSFGNMAEITKNLVITMGDLYNMLTPENMGDAMKKFTEAIREATGALRNMSGNKAPPETVPGTNGKPVLKPQVPKEGPGSELKLDFRGQPLPSGKTTPELEKILSDPIFSGRRITSTNDSDHKPGSKHYEGKAADISLKNMTPEEIVAFVNSVAGLPGVSKAFAEDKPGSEVLAKIKELGGKTLVNASATGLHLHMEAMAKGGITNGASIAGEAGPEAVIPLPDGRTIPVRMDMSEMVTKLEQMVDLLREQRDNSEKMLYAVQ